MDTIRLDWYATLENVNNGAELSLDISWSFTAQDLLVLTCLHEAGIHREKIEDLLEDCNFHRENGLLHEGKYSELREEICRDLVEIPAF